jgi:hypothetical protein
MSQLGGIGRDLHALRFGQDRFLLIHGGRARARR